MSDGNVCCNIIEVVMGKGLKSKGENGKLKAKLRQHEQRTSNEVRTQFVPFGARTANDGKGESEASSA